MVSALSIADNYIHKKFKFQDNWLAHANRIAKSKKIFYPTTCKKKTSIETVAWNQIPAESVHAIY